MEKAEEGGDLPASSPRRKGYSPSDPSFVRLKCCLTSIVATFVLLGVSLWYFIPHTYPRCYIQSFDVLALKQTTRAFEHNTIDFEVELVNRRSGHKAIYYDALDFAFYYKQNNLSSSYLLVGNTSFDPYYQRVNRRSSYRVGHFEAKGMSWGNVTTPAAFRVELTTATRFSQLFWKGKRHHMVAGADIQVNDEGSLVKSERLRSNNAGKIISKSRLQLVGILIIFMIIHSW